MNFNLNIKLIIISCMLCFMASCSHDAPDDPYVALDLQWDFSASAVTPTTALVKAMLPEDCEYILWRDNVKVGLSENKSEDIDEIKSENLIYGDLTWGLYRSNIHARFFDNLKPNTTYYTVVRVESVLFDSHDKRYDYVDYYFNGYSFTTPTAGDYSGLFEEITCTPDLYSGGMVVLLIHLPYGLRLGEDSELRVSSSPDMKDFKSYHLDGSNNEFNYFDIERPEKGRSYFEIVGRMVYMDLYDWNGEVLEVRIPGYLDFN